jgi:hypothetical protein
MEISESAIACTDISPVILFMNMVDLRAATLIAMVSALFLSCTPAVQAPGTAQNKTSAPAAVVSPVSPNPVSSSPADSVPVPGEYKQLYQSLSDKLDLFDKGLDKQCAGENGKITFGAELLGANCHAGEQLLNPTYYGGIVVWLDALKGMGVTGVKIAIDYPFFMPDFPNNDAYIKVYKNIVQECRNRNMTVYIANGNLFGPPFTNLKYPLAGLTLDKYRQGKRQTVETILKELHPDYLTVANEPTTEAMLTGISQTPEQFAGTTSYILKGLQHPGTLMGSGTGTWSNMSYISQLVAIPELDYIDMHIYPVDYLQGAVDAAAIARSNNKRIALAEIGLYKMRPEDMGGLGKLATQATIYGRDVFSFWAPLDNKFLNIVVKMARCNGYEFISPFWSTYLFSYVDYNELTRFLGYSQLRQLDNIQAYKNASEGRLSPWGEAYKKLIAANSSLK